MEISSLPADLFFFKAASLKSLFVNNEEGKTKYDTVLTKLTTCQPLSEDLKGA